MGLFGTLSGSRCFSGVEVDGEAVDESVVGDLGADCDVLYRDRTDLFELIGKQSEQRWCVRFFCSFGTLYRQMLDGLGFGHEQSWHDSPADATTCYKHHAMQWKLLLATRRLSIAGLPTHRESSSDRRRFGAIPLHLTGERQYWLGDGYSDCLRSFNWAMAAIPALAPAGKSHLLGSTSVVQRITWGPDRITYRTYGAESTEVLRVAFQPGWIAAGGQVLHREPPLDSPGYTLQSIGDGSFVLDVHRVHSHNVVVTTDTPACGSGPWSAWLLCLSAPS